MSLEGCLINWLYDNNQNPGTLSTKDLPAELIDSLRHHIEKDNENVANGSCPSLPGETKVRYLAVLREYLNHGHQGISQDAIEHIIDTLEAIIPFRSVGLPEEFEACRTLIDSYEGFLSNTHDLKYDWIKENIEKIKNMRKYRKAPWPVSPFAAPN